MNIKKIYRLLRTKIDAHIRKWEILRVYYNDYKYYVSNSLTLFGGGDLNEKIKGLILLHAHSLEKGMSFQTKKANWGALKASQLCNYINALTHEDTICEECVLAINVLNKYVKDEYASKDSALTNKIKDILERYKSVIDDSEYGLKEVSEPPVFDKEVIQQFMSSRSSVRYFSAEPVTKAEIDGAMEIAYLTPTACNRQTSRVYAFRNKGTIQNIIDNQLGDQGWCNNADVLFVITGIQSCFGGSYERQQVYIDGGLFAMNFTWGLHLQHIASCFKMFVRDPKLQDKVKKICHIPENEVPIVLILAGHYKQESIMSPKSHRIKHPVIYES